MSFLLLVGFKLTFSCSVLFLSDQFTFIVSLILIIQVGFKSMVTSKQNEHRQEVFTSGNLEFTNSIVL